MVSPFGNVLNTRESYSRFYQKNFTEVEVQFSDEDPAWIPLNTLLVASNKMSTKTLLLVSHYDKELRRF